MRTDDPGPCRWDFEDVEDRLRSYAQMTDAAYNERRPLEFLDDDAARRAIAAMGVSMADVAALVDYHYQTVVGWFRRCRTLSRGTVCDCLFPALCEAYVRHVLPRTPLAKHYAGEDLIPAIEAHVALLLCTGEAMLPEEREDMRNHGRDVYKRALVHFAASFLTCDELESVAISCLSMLQRREQLLGDVDLTALEEHTMRTLDRLLWADEDHTCDYLSPDSPAEDLLCPSAILLSFASIAKVLRQYEDGDLGHVCDFAEALAKARHDESRNTPSTDSPFDVLFSV